MQRPRRARHAARARRRRQAPRVTLRHWRGPPVPRAPFPPTANRPPNPPKRGRAAPPHLARSEAGPARRRRHPSPHPQVRVPRAARRPPRAAPRAAHDCTAMDYCVCVFFERRCAALVSWPAAARRTGAAPRRRPRALSLRLCLPQPARSQTGGRTPPPCLAGATPKQPSKPGARPRGPRRAAPRGPPFFEATHRHAPGRAKAPGPHPFTAGGPQSLPSWFKRDSNAVQTRFKRAPKSEHASDALWARAHAAARSTPARAR